MSDFFVAVDYYKILIAKGKEPKCKYIYPFKKCKAHPKLWHIPFKSYTCQAEIVEL